MDVIRKYLSKNWEILIIFFIALTPLLWLRDGHVILGHDTNFRVNHSEWTVSSTYSWIDTTYYGKDWTYDRGYLPVNIVQLLLLKVTPSYSAMQSIFFVYLFLLLGFSAYFLVAGIFPEKKHSAFRLISATLSMFNFFILQGWFIADTGRFLVFAGLPLYILVIHNLFTHVWSSKKSYIIFAILSFFFNGNGLPPLVGFQAIGVGLVGLLYAIFHVKRNHWSGVWFSVKSALVLLFIFTLINAYWLLPVINFTGASYTAVFSSSGGVEGTLAWEKMISKYASIVNLFRMQGIPDWYDNPIHAYSNPYISNPVLIFLSFVPVLTIIAGLFIFKLKGLLASQKRFIAPLSVVLLFGLFLSSGTHPPFGKIYELFMRHIPGFVIFRSSLYKFGFAFWVPMIILFGYFSGEFLNKVIKKGKILNITLGLLLLGIIGYHYPYFSPEKIFHLTGIFKTRLAVPEYVTEALEYIDKEIPESSRILMLPDLDREYIGIPVDAYDWGFYSLILLPNFISNHTYIADKESDTIIQMIYRSIYVSDESSFNRLTGKTGISYILFRKDVQLSPGALKLHPIADVENALSSIPSVRLVKEFGRWRLYAISTSKDISMVSPLQSYDLILSPTSNSSYLTARDGNDGHGIVQTFSDETARTLQKSAVSQFIEAECYLCKQDEYSQLVSGITLPGKETLPRFISDPLSSRQEKQNLSVTENNPKERIDVDLSLSQQSLALLVTAPKQTLKERYQVHIRDTMENLNRLSGRDRNVYAIRVKAYFASQLVTLGQHEGLKSEKELVAGFVSALEKEAWYTTDVSRLRFGFTVPSDGTYRFYIPNESQFAREAVIDNKNVSISIPISLNAGFHTAELHRTNSDSSVFSGPPALFIEQPQKGKTFLMPKLTYTKVDPTMYRIRVAGATEPYVLQLNQQYDPRWQATITNTGDTLGDADHVMINGYANGWYVNTLGDYDVELSYSPQRIFYIGLIVSGVSVLTVIALLGYSLLKKRGQRHV